MIFLDPCNITLSHIFNPPDIHVVLQVSQLHFDSERIVSGVINKHFIILTLPACQMINSRDNLL